MTNVYLICLLLTPVLTSGLGLAWYKNPPKEIDHYAGYRTKRAMKNTETWIYAQKYAGKLWTITGIPTLILTIFLLYCKEKFANNIENIFLAFLGIQLLIASIPIPFVEHALKKKFNNPT